MQFVAAGAGNVISHGYHFTLNALGQQTVPGQTEVQHVTCVVAVAQQHAAALMGDTRNVVDLLRGR